MSTSPFLRSLLLLSAVLACNISVVSSSSTTTSKTAHQPELELEVASSSSSSSLRGLANNENALIAQQQPQPRIIGGSNVNDPGRYPYIALMNGKSLCDAVLISKRFVLTAAHCAGADNDFEVGVSENKSGSKLESWWDGRSSSGSSGKGTKYAYANGVIHPDYDDNNTDNDIALFELNRDVPSTVQYLSLRRDPVASSGTAMTVIGFGDTDKSEYITEASEVLQQATVNYVTADACRSKFSDTGYIIGPDMLCAFRNGQDVGVGVGDSGGPLLLKGGNAEQDALVGLVSWGAPDADNSHPGVYTRISYFYDWIIENMCDMNPEGVPDYVDCVGGGVVVDVDVDVDVDDTPPTTGTGNDDVQGFIDDDYFTYGDDDGYSTATFVDNFVNWFSDLLGF